MKLFDYKFILLILLSIIVYYLYIEVDKINVKINQTKGELESKMLVIDNKIRNQPRQISMTRIPQTFNTTQPTNDIKCDIPVEVNNQLINIPLNEINTTTLPNSSCQLDDDSTTEYDEDSDGEDVMLDSDDIVIYSNDNEENNPNETEDVTENIVVTDLDETHNVEETQDVEETQELEETQDDESEKKKKLLTEIEEVSQLDNYSYTTSNNDLINVDIDIEELVNEESVEPKFQIKKLKRKKIDELRSLASELEISTNKVVDGKLKNKTKKELCNEIIESQSC